MTEMYVKNHRDQLILLGFAVCLAFILGLGPTTERALFLTGSPVAPKAFTAVAPAMPPTGSLPEFGAKSANAFLARLRRPNVGGLVGPGLTDARPGLILGGSDDPTPADDVPPVDLSSLSGPSRSLQGGPLAGASRPGFSPAGPADATSSPVPGVIDPVGPVPEPTAWAMMILGFFLVGHGLRRGRSRSVQPQPISGNVN